MMRKSRKYYSAIRGEKLITLAPVVSLCEHARTLYIPAWSAVVKDAAGAGDALMAP